MLKNLLRKLLMTFFILSIWFIASTYIVESSSVLPSPIKILNEYRELLKSPNFYIDLSVSMTRIILGFSLGATLGVLLGILTGINRWLNEYFVWFIQVLRPITPVALAPFFILWFGLGEQSVITLIAWGAFFPSWVAAHAGVTTVDPILIWSAKTLGFSKFEFFLNIYILGALRFIVSGTRTAIGIAFICLFIGETLGTSSGLGYRLSLSYEFLRIDRMLAYLLIFGVLGASADYLYISLINLAFPWLPSETQASTKQ